MYVILYYAYYDYIKFYICKCCAGNQNSNTNNIVSLDGPLLEPFSFMQPQKMTNRFLSFDKTQHCSWGHTL